MSNVFVIKYDKYQIIIICVYKEISTLILTWSYCDGSNNKMWCSVNWPMRKLIKINFYKCLYLFQSELIHIQNKVLLEGKLKLGQLVHLLDILNTTWPVKI